MSNKKNQGKTTLKNNPTTNSRSHPQNVAWINQTRERVGHFDAPHCNEFGGAVTTACPPSGVGMKG